MNEKLYELIEDYNLGRLKPPQLEQFEAALGTDPALADAVGTQRAEWEMRELLAENALRTHIRQSFAEQPPSLWITRNWKWLLPALLFVGLAGFLFYRNTPAPAETSPTTTPPVSVPADTVPTIKSTPQRPSEQEVREPKTADPRIYAVLSYDVPESLSGLRGGATDDTLGLAQEAFMKKNYRKVISLLAVLPSDEQQEALQLRAHANFILRQYKGAAGDFARLEAGGIYRREAQWYGLLSRMATLDVDRKVWIKEVDAIRKDSTHPYRKQAEALWQRVNK